MLRAAGVGAEVGGWAVPMGDEPPTQIMAEIGLSSAPDPTVLTLSITRWSWGYFGLLATACFPSMSYASPCMCPLPLPSSRQLFPSPTRHLGDLSQVNQDELGLPWTLLSSEKDRKEAGRGSCPKMGHSEAHPWGIPGAPWGYGAVMAIAPFHPSKKGFLL